MKSEKTTSPKRRGRKLLALLLSLSMLFTVTAVPVFAAEDEESGGGDGILSGLTNPLDLIGDLTDIDLSAITDLANVITTFTDSINSLMEFVQNLPDTFKSVGDAVNGTVDSLKGTVDAVNNGIDALTTGFKNMTGIFDKTLSTVEHVSDNIHEDVQSVIGLGSQALGLYDHTLDAATHISDNHADVKEKALDTVAPAVPDLNTIAGRIQNNVDEYVAPDTHDFVSNIINEDLHIGLQASSADYAAKVARKNTIANRIEEATNSESGSTLPSFDLTAVADTLKNLFSKTSNTETETTEETTSSVLSNVLRLNQSSTPRLAITAEQKAAQTAAETVAATTETAAVSTDAAKAAVEAARKAVANNGVTLAAETAKATTDTATSTADTAKTAAANLAALMNGTASLSTTNGTFLGIQPAA